ncbi:hypothetical protein [Fodinicola acaciae]|uniref:hypothetical protein n=1 Tax=Fodinicola acaciae TaxID=2681555 RepID=UPI0013D29127|nr:hypothetical protein [Fodinicola acaciae]
MASRISQIPGDLPFHILECDGCGSAYECFDATGYDLDALVASAREAGWTTQPHHHCPRCAASELVAA